MNVLKLIMLQLKLKKIEEEFNKAKTGRPEILNQIRTITSKIIEIINNERISYVKLDHRYEAKQIQYEDLKFNECFVFNAIGRILNGTDGNYIVKRFPAFKIQDICSESADTYDVSAELHIFGRREFIDSFREKKLTTRWSATKFLNDCINSGESFLIHFSTCYSLNKEGSFELNGTDEYPITLYEPEPSESEPYTILHIMNEIVEYAKTNGTDFDISTFIEYYKRKYPRVVLKK